MHEEDFLFSNPHKPKLRSATGRRFPGRCIAVAGAACLGFVSPATAQYNEEIGAEITPITAERSPMVERALFAQDGKSSAVIAYPSRQPEARSLAEEIQTVFRERFAIEIPVRASSEISRTDYAEKTVIHLGNIYTNPELLWFYIHSFTYADASWPGGDGWAIQQAHDPKGYGQNVLIVAASSDAGLESGVARFVEEIDQLSEPTWSEFILVESDTPPVTESPRAMSDAEVKELEVEYLEAMRDNSLRHTAEQAIWEAKYYVMSGNENHLAKLRACAPAHLQFLKEGGNQQAETIYFWFYKYAQIWDAVEHSDYWDAEFRDTMVNLLYWLSETVVSIGHFDRSQSSYPKNNHETYPAISLLFSSAYFHKYYNIERADHWRNLADEVLQRQAEFVRGMDEARFYYEHSSMHALYYAIATGDRTFIENGNAREFADLLMMLVDNTGNNPNFGDARRYNRDRTYYYLLPFANVSGDPAYLGLSNLTREYTENPQSIWEQGPRGHYHSLHLYIPPAEPELPPSPPGVRVFRLEEALYERERNDPIFPHIPPPEVWTPFEDTFDKLLFRNGYDSRNQYLLLDGYGRGIHSHRDANVITRFTDNDRIWLVDDTYFRNSAAYHNALMVIKDGEGGFSPPFAALETAASMEQTGFSRTTAPDFNGIDWTRNIFWIREDAFIVIDEALARESGDYTLQTFWRGLGEMSEQPHGVQLEQEGESFRISFPANVGVRSAADHNNTQDEGTWGPYPHAEPVVKRTMAYQTPTMEAGDLHSFQAVLYTFPSDEPREIDCRNLSETTLLTREQDETRLFFSAPDALPPFLDTDARMGIVTPNLISLTNATRFSFDGNELLQASSPVSCEIDLVEGTITLMPQEDALVTDLAATAEAHAAKQQKQDLPGAQAIASSLAANLDRLWANTPVDERPDPDMDLPALEPSFLRGFADLTIHAAVITGLDESSGHDFVFATDDGLQAWSAVSGENPLWEYSTSAPVHAMTAANFGGEPVIVFGTVDGKITALNPDGSERWVYQIQRRPDSLYGRGARVFSISTADTDNNGFDEILVTTSHWMSYFLNSEGELIWGDPVARNGLISSAFGDLNGDGNQELLIGSENFRMHAFTPDYRILWTFRNKRGTIDRIQTADIDGDGADEVLIGSSDGHVYAVKSQAEEMVPTEYHERDRALRPFDVLFEYDTGGDVLALTAGDLDQDGTTDVIVGSDSFLLYRFGGDGTLKSMANAGDMVRHVSLLDRAPNEQRIAAGLANGRVLLLSPSLEPIALADIGSEVLKVKFDPKSNRLFVIGRSSLGVFQNN